MIAKSDSIMSRTICGRRRSDVQTDQGQGSDGGINESGSCFGALIDGEGGEGGAGAAGDGVSEVVADGNGGQTNSLGESLDEPGAHRCAPEGEGEAEGGLGGECDEGVSEGDSGEHGGAEEGEG